MKTLKFEEDNFVDTIKLDEAFLAFISLIIRVFYSIYCAMGKVRSFLFSGKRKALFWTLKSTFFDAVLLHELDKELTKRKLKFVRYADDFSIYCTSKTQATATMKAISSFLKTKLKLTINADKSGIRKPVQFVILGFGFVPRYKKGDRGKYQLVVNEKAWKRLKQNLKAITRKTTPMSFDERIAKINEVQRGWLNYFQGTSIYGKLRDLDGWLRNRLRYCIWHQWKKPERRRKNFIRLGVDHNHAYAWSRTRKGGWAIAQSPIMGTTITLERLKRRGYIPLLDVYISLNPSICEPPYTQVIKLIDYQFLKLGSVARYVRWCERRTLSSNRQSRLLD